MALKVLPAAFSEDPKRMARFEREPQVLASLSHPTVAGIYGFEESDGIRCLVLELIEGDLLTDRLGEGSLALKETLESMGIINEVRGANSGRWVDDNTVVCSSGNQIRLLDTVFGQIRNLYTAALDVTMSIAGFSPDQRTLYLTTSGPPESDIWLLTLP